MGRINILASGKTTLWIIFGWFDVKEIQCARRGSMQDGEQREYQDERRRHEPSKSLWRVAASFLFLMNANQSAETVVRNVRCLVHLSLAMHRDSVSFPFFGFVSTLYWTIAIFNDFSQKYLAVEREENWFQLEFRQISMFNLNQMK